METKSMKQMVRELFRDSGLYNDEVETAIREFDGDPATILAGLMYKRESDGSVFMDEFEVWQRTLPVGYWVNKLMKYCHDERCEYPRECPKSHTLCFTDLDLNTSIAWILMDMWNENEFNGSEGKACVTFAWRIVGLHFEKYPILYTLVNNIYHILRRNDV
jgi:hypothetical protein